MCITFAFAIHNYKKTIYNKYVERKFYSNACLVKFLLWVFSFLASRKNLFLISNKGKGVHNMAAKKKAKKKAKKAKKAR